MKHTTIQILSILLLFGVNTMLQSQSKHALYFADGIISQRTFCYFTDSVLQKEPIFVNSKIYFDGTANDKRSNLSAVIHCLDNDFLVNVESLKKICRKQKKTRSKAILLENHSNRYIAHKEKDTYTLVIYAPVEYESLYYQEYFLKNEEKGSISIIISIDENNLTPVDYCISPPSSL